MLIFFVSMNTAHIGSNVPMYSYKISMVMCHLVIAVGMNNMALRSGHIFYVSHYIVIIYKGFCMINTNCFYLEILQSLYDLFLTVLSVNKLCLLYNFFT